MIEERKSWAVMPLIPSAQRTERFSPLRRFAPAGTATRERTDPLPLTNRFGFPPTGGRPV
jgi:hypothetical protein